MKLGAGVRDLPYVKGTYGIFHEPHPGEDGTGILAVYKGAVAVDRSGRRFVDESIPYKALGDASLAQQRARTWQVFDATVMAQSNDEVPIYDFAGRLRAGMLEVADSVEELAATLGTEPGVLEETVADYNDRIATARAGRARSGAPRRPGRSANSHRHPAVLRPALRHRRPGAPTAASPSTRRCACSTSSASPIDRGSTPPASSSAASTAPAT